MVGPAAHGSGRPGAEKAPLEVELSGAAALEEGTWSRMRERRGSGRNVSLPRR